MYCRYTKTTIWDNKKCALNGGEFYCVLYRECPLLDVPLYSQICFLLYCLLAHLPQLVLSTKQIHIGTIHRCCCFTGFKSKSW